MGKQLQQWLEEFVQNGANPSRVANWPDEVQGKNGGVEKVISVNSIEDIDASFIQNNKEDLLSTSKILVGNNLIYHKYVNKKIYGFKLSAKLPAQFIDINEGVLRFINININGDINWIEIDSIKNECREGCIKNIIYAGGKGIEVEDGKIQLSSSAGSEILSQITPEWGIVFSENSIGVDPNKVMSNSDIWMNPIKQDGDQKLTGLYYKGEKYQIEKVKTKKSFTRHWSHFGLKTGYGLGLYTWSDGVNTYQSAGTDQYVWNKKTHTWTRKTWTGLSNFVASNIWRNGEDFYHSNNSQNWKLKKDRTGWDLVNFLGLNSPILGKNVWTDGVMTYYSSGDTQLIFDNSNLTWYPMAWNGITGFSGTSLVTFKDKVFVCESYKWYKLDKTSNTWIQIDWWSKGISMSGNDWFWTDGDNLYYSEGSYNQKVLKEDTLEWESITWTGDCGNLTGSSVWTDGENIYGRTSDGYLSFLTWNDEEQDTVNRVAITGDYDDLKNKPAIPTIIPNLTTTITGSPLNKIFINGGFYYITQYPDAPTSDGTYQLEVTVSNGTPTYQWVLKS